MASQPGEGPLDDPAAREDLEAARGRRRLAVGPAPDPARRALDDRDGPAQCRFDPVFAAAAIARVDPQMCQARETAILSVEHQEGTVTVGDVGGMNDRAQEEALGIDQQMPLAATQFLRAIIAAGPPFSVVLTDWLSRLAALGSGWRPID